MTDGIQPQSYRLMCAATVHTLYYFNVGAADGASFSCIQKPPAFSRWYVHFKLLDSADAWILVYLIRL